jgi:glutathione synthase/RimK-type ligase-like ATP-grasp enzyme
VSARIALVSARAARDLDEDMPPLLAAFAAAGAKAQIAVWDDPAVDWARFDAALLRSAWDYAERIAEFLAWVERAAALTALLNPPPVVRWNADKHYLLAIADAGGPIVPTRFVEPGSDPEHALQGLLAQQPCAEVVVKPAVGAGARDARRHARSATDEILTHMRQLLTARRSVMLQPYLESVEQHGETALMFIGGRFSHAIGKKVPLPAGAPATAGLFAPEQISPRIPGADELAVAERVLGPLPFGPLLYARVDLIRDRAGAPCVLELELTEPSMFLAHVRGAAQRLAAAALAWIARR